MKIDILGHRIEGDGSGVVLSTLTTVKEGPRAGEEALSAVRFYKHLEQALVAIARDVAAADDVTTLEAYVSRLRAAEEHIRVMVGPGQMAGEIYQTLADCLPEPTAKEPTS